MSCTYLYYTYPQLLLLRTLYVLGNKPRFLLFLASFAVYLIPIIGWLYAIITPITVAFFLNLTDPRKVQLKLNLDSFNDFYNFSKLKEALANDARARS